MALPGLLCRFRRDRLTVQRRDGPVQRTQNLRFIADMILGENLPCFGMNALKQLFQNDPRLKIVHSRASSSNGHSALSRL